MNPVKLLLLLLLCAGCNQNQAGKNINDNQSRLDTVAGTYAVESEDASMNAAIEKAKKTIDQFDRALKSNDTALTDFAIKKRFSTPDGGGEHMWIAGVSFVNGNYKGFVNNDAEKTKEVKYGDTVVVSRDEITDWMYLEHNLLNGGYTIREIRNQLTKEERVKMDNDLGFKIKD
jgi:uncharacterized protein YegJ (DUF2314 family)